MSNNYRDIREFIPDSAQKDADSLIGFLAHIYQFEEVLNIKKPKYFYMYRDWCSDHVVMCQHIVLAKQAGLIDYGYTKGFEDYYEKKLNASLDKCIKATANYGYGNWQKPLIKYFDRRYRTDELYRFWVDNDYDFSIVYLTLTSKGKEYVPPNYKCNSFIFKSSYLFDVDTSFFDYSEEDKLKLIYNAILLLSISEDKTMDILDWTHELTISFRVMLELAIYMQFQLSFITSEYLHTWTNHKFSPEDSYNRCRSSSFIDVTLTERGEHFALLYAKNHQVARQTIINYGGQVNISKDGSTLNAKQIIKKDRFSSEE